MLLELFLSFFAIFLLLMVTEYLWRSKRLHIETSRKIVHIGTGVIIAFWPYFISWELIQLASLLLLAVVFISYRFKIFRSIHSIKRLTVGELLYPVGIGLCTLLEPAPWAFTIAILHLTLADGLAAVAGIKYGRRTMYNILSHKKSLVGSGVFFTTSLVILVTASWILPDSDLPEYYGYFLLISLGLTVIENLSWYGLDDISVPLATIALLHLLPM